MLRQGDLKFDCAQTQVKRHHQALAGQHRHLSSSASDERRERRGARITDRIQEYARAAGDNVGQFSDAAFGQLVELRERPIHDLANEGERRVASHPDDHQAGDPLPRDQGIYVVAGPDRRRLQGGAAAVDAQSRLVGQDVDGGVEKRVDELDSHTGRSAQRSASVWRTLRDSDHIVLCRGHIDKLIINDRGKMPYPSSLVGSLNTRFFPKPLAL